MNNRYVNCDLDLIRKKLKPLLAFLLMTLFSTAASACSCGLKTLDDHVANADIIYFARLEQARLVKGELGKQWPFIEGEFEVQRSLKGPRQSGTVTLRTGVGGGDCGISMLVSETYIIFAEKGRDGISICDGSGMVYKFQEDEMAAKVQAALKKLGKRLPKQ